MGQQSWTITDVESGVNVEQLELTRREIKRAPASFQVSKQTLRGGLQDGVDLLTVNNGKVSIDILPTRGMSLWQASIDGDRIGWRFDDESASGLHLRNSWFAVAWRAMELRSLMTRGYSFIRFMDELATGRPSTSQFTWMMTRG